MKFSWCESAVFWDPVVTDSGEPYEGQSLYDEYWCYFSITFQRCWVWGYFCLPYDGQGHEGFGLGWCKLNWSTSNSYERAYAQKAPTGLMSVFRHKWPTEKKK